MTERDFVYWLNGMIEGHPGLERLDKYQLEIIKQHLKLVLTKVTPNYGNSVTVPNIFPHTINCSTVTDITRAPGSITPCS